MRFLVWLFLNCWLQSIGGSKGRSITFADDNEIQYKKKGILKIPIEGRSFKRTLSSNDALMELEKLKSKDNSRAPSEGSNPPAERDEKRLAREPRKDEDPFVAAFSAALQELLAIFTKSSPADEFFTQEEHNLYLHRIGKQKQISNLAVRMSRPAGLFIVHLIICYDFPFSPATWMLMFALDMLLLVLWRQLDQKWMVEELGHWDYLVGVGLLFGAGIISVIHQLITLLADVFFLLAPVMLICLYTGILFYGALYRKVY